MRWLNGGNIGSLSFYCLQRDLTLSYSQKPADEVHVLLVQSGGTCRPDTTACTLVLASLTLEITGACEISEHACKSPGRCASCSLISASTLWLGRRPWALLRARAPNTQLCCEWTSLLMLDFFFFLLGMDQNLDTTACLVCTHKCSSVLTWSHAKVINKL